MRSTTVIDSAGRSTLAGAHVAHPFLEPAFEMQATDDPAGDDRDGEAEPEIGQRDLPADKREEQPERDLVDHRRGDQEREGHAERHAGRDEADKQRHGRAGAERREDAEHGRRDIADPLTLPGEHGAGAFGRKETAHHAHAEDDERQQHQHFRRVVDEELGCLLEVAARGDRQVRRHPVGELRQLPVDHEPECDQGRRRPDP